MRGVHAAVEATVRAPGNTVPPAANPVVILVRAGHRVPATGHAVISVDHRDADTRVLVVCGADEGDDAALGAWLAAGADAVVPFSCEETTLAEVVGALSRGGDGVSRRRRAELLATARHHAEAWERLERLSPREARVLAGLVTGQTAQQMADEDIVSISTIRSQLRAVLRKLDVAGALAAVALARNAGWERPDGPPRPEHAPPGRPDDRPTR